jgi:hypothetical protein
MHECLVVSSTPRAESCRCIVNVVLSAMAVEMRPLCLVLFWIRTSRNSSI